MKTVVIVRPPPSGPGAGASWANPTAVAFTKCFTRLGWQVNETTERIAAPGDVIAGYGWRPVIREAWERWPERIIHTDAAWWRRDRYLKLAHGDRWSPFTGRDYPDNRLRDFGIKILPSRLPGKRVLVCGMSEKHAGTIGLMAEQWERDAVRRLLAAGAVVTYRPKPNWPGARPIPGSTFDRGGTIVEALSRVDAVVSHHSNCAVDAAVYGVPFFVETSLAKPLSVSTIEDAIGATASDIETRRRFCAEVAWHQWSISEISEGAWLRQPAPLANHPLFA